MLGLGININIINTTGDLPVCTSIQDIKEAKTQDAHLQEFKAYVIHGQLHKKDVAQVIQKYMPIRHELAMIDGVAVKSK